MLKLHFVILLLASKRDKSISLVAFLLNLRDSEWVKLAKTCCFRESHAWLSGDAWGITSVEGTHFWRLDQIIIFLYLINIHDREFDVKLFLLAKIALPLCLVPFVFSRAAVFIAELSNQFLSGAGRIFWVALRLFWLVQPILDNVLVVLVNVYLLGFKKGALAEEGGLFRVSFAMRNEIVCNS